LGKPIQYLSCSRPFGGVEESGFGRETIKNGIDHYRVKKHDFLRQRTGWILLIRKLLLIINKRLSQFLRHFFLLI
jgi:hypothetical protein